MSVQKLKRADATGNAVIAKALEKEVPIAVGAEAKAVKWLERMLKVAGFNPGTLDTKFDAKTQAALREFQGARGLPPTGELDAKTFRDLKAVVVRARQHHGKNVFGVGQKNAFVKTAESRLRKLGYDTGKVDGTFDLRTKAAMEQYKADQGKKEFKKASGWVGDSAQRSLARELKAQSHAPYRARVTKNHAERKRLDALTADQVRKTREVPVLDAKGNPKLDVDGVALTRTLTGLVRGDKNNAVKNLQSRLKAAGFDPKRTDGVFDERTEGALKAFQRRSKMEPNGRVGPMTWKKLAKSVMYAKDGTSPAQDVGERSAAVKRSEQLLKKLGFNPGNVDGIFDNKTLAASRRAEKMLGMKVDGSIGATQLKKMKQATQGVTLGQLRSIMPTLPQSKARAYLPLLNRAMAEAQINTLKRKAMFIAQLAHESVSLRYFEEIASGAAYEGRRDLGNTQPGDGVRFKGRGPIQVTGRYNYRAAGKALGLPLESNPKMASRPDVGFRIAAWYWKSRGLNTYADRGDFREVTRRINGGYNGLADRQAYYSRALRALS